MGAFFLLELDAYLYTLGIIDARPWQIFLVSFVGFSLFVAVRHFGRPDQVSFSPETFVLLAALGIYVSCQILGILSWAAAPDELRLLVYWVYMLPLIGLGILIGHELGEYKATAFFGWLVLIVGVMLLDRIAPVPLSLLASTGSRSAGTLLNANEAAFVVAALGIGALRWNRTYFSYSDGAAIVLSGYATILTGSRGGALTLFGVLVLYATHWLSSSRNWSEVPIRLFVVVVGGVWVIILILIGILFTRYGSDLTISAGISTFNDAAATERFAAVEIAIEKISRAPWLGYGTGYVYSQVLGPHNMFLRALVEGGVVGLLGFLALPAGLLWWAIKRRAWDLTTLTFSALVMSMTSHNVTEDRSLLIIFGIMLGSAALERQPRQKSSSRPLRYH